MLRRLEYFLRDTHSDDYGLSLVKEENLYVLISRVIFSLFLFLPVIYTVKRGGIHVVAASTCLGIFDPKVRIHSLFFLYLSINRIYFE